MILYHFTSLAALTGIRKEGLSRGDVPITPRETMRVVWLTTDADPSGHGLTEARPLTDLERKNLSRFLGQTVPEGAEFDNKRAVCITVKIPTTDRRLKHWPAWSKKRPDPHWRAALDATGGSKSASWWTGQLLRGPGRRPRRPAYRGAVVQDQSPHRQLDTVNCNAFPSSN